MVFLLKVVYTLHKTDVFFLNLQAVSKERKFLMEYFDEDFTIKPDYSLPGFNRYSSTDPRFPLSLSYPKDLDVKYDSYSVFVDFGRNPWEISVSRWDCTEERYNFQGDDLYKFIKQDMEKLMSSTRYVSALVSRYRMESALVGERAMKFPRAIYESPAHRYGERVYVLRPYDPPSIIWTIWRNADADLAEDTFKIVLRSLRWL
jgi:hypothetical protein